MVAQRIHRLVIIGKFILLVINAGRLTAQDRRAVREPIILPSCVALKADKAAIRGELSVEDEARPDTARIQQAIDNCAVGHSVELTTADARNAFLTGPLQLKAGVFLNVAKGAILFGSRNPRDYDISPGTCGIVAEQGHGCKALINGDHADDTGIAGDGTIDGRGGAKLLNQDVSWWDLAQEAKRLNKNQSCPRLIIVSNCNNFTLYRITLANSPNFHVSYNRGQGFTAWGVIINSPKTSRNTDGIDPANATDVTITHCFIHTGDDNVAIKAGGHGPSTHITISHNHFYTGHGMSIGSETDAGASEVFVTDLTIDGADNGLRIKSNAGRGGLVENVVYQDVCIRRTKNPILMDSTYTATGLPAGKQDKIPVFRNITLRNVHISEAGTISLKGYDQSHQLNMNLDNVTTQNPISTKIVAEHAALTLGPGPVSFRPSGPDVHVVQMQGKEAAKTCENAFQPMP